MIEVNVKYFDKIDNEEKAYWLGYLWADGYSAQKAPWFICIQTIDKDHVIKFSNTIEYKGTIKNVSTGGFENSKNMSRIVICKKYMCNRLNELGRNNTEMHIPNIPNNLKRHFIRGYFDGDGSVYTYNKSGIPKGSTKRYSYVQLEASIIGTLDILNDIEECLIDIKCRYKKSKTDYMKYLVISNKKDLVNFFNYLYKDAIVYLERKYLKFKNYYGPAEE